VVSGTQHFAAGVVIAALAGELLPDLRHEGNLGWAAAGFTAGVALVLGLAAYGRRLDGQRESVQKSSAADHVATRVGCAVGGVCKGD
jgi:ZIP family zinc transporter